MRSNLGRSQRAGRVTEGIGIVPRTVEGNDQQIRRLQDRLRLLSEVTRGFALASTDYERLLERVATDVTRAVRESCAVLLLNEPGDALVVAAEDAVDAEARAGMFATLPRPPLRLAEEPALRQVIDSGETQVVANLQGHLTEAAPRDPEAAHRDPAQRGCLLVALRASGRAIGVLAIGRFRESSPAFDEEDRDLAQNLADHASLAIENARLFAAAQQARRAAEVAEAAVRASEATHRLFFEASPVATFVFDHENLRLLAANESALQLYGYSREEFLQLDLVALRAPGEEEQLRAMLRNLGDADAQAIGRHLRKDRSPIYVDGHSHVSTYQGRPARFVVVIDHTERYLAEAARLESEQRLERTLDEMIEGYTILDSDLRFVYLNEAAARQARRSKSGVIGKRVEEVIPELASSPIIRLVRRAIEQRESRRLEEILIEFDGIPSYFDLDLQATPRGLVIRSMDATARKLANKQRDALEEQLRQAQKMDAVGRLAGGVAHDFNNVLSVILGYSDTLLGDLSADNPMRADIEEVQKAAQRATQLTQQLLMFSRQQVIEPRVIDPNEVLRGMANMFRRLLGAQLELRLVLEDELGRVRADRNNLEQVLLNLVVNARDAMPDGGRLTIESANVTLDESFCRTHLGTAPGNYVLLAVTDTGVGMDKATQLRIFEPFFTTKEHGKGTGLGLSTVFGIVQQSGGGVWVYSEPGQGSTFKVYLPRVEAAVDTRGSERPLRSGRGTETILLVEDEEAVRTVARRLLERGGYHVLSAENAGDALRLLEQKSEPIQLLLTDVVMPNMSGAELALRVAKRWPELKVLYMSGYTDGSIVSHGVLDGGVSFLQKPFTSERLMQKVRSTLDGLDE